jgi:hypothetical protein
MARALMAATLAVACVMTTVGVRPTTAAASAVAAQSGTRAVVGHDISWPQCPSSVPRTSAFGIVGVTDGLPWSANPCLQGEWQWATSRHRSAGLYLNTANPGPSSSHWNLGGPKTCANPSSLSDTGCAYDYGWNAAAQGYATASTQLSATAAASHAWWLDVEQGNSWNGTAAANAADIQGYLDYLTAQHVPSVGVYSTAYQWGQITGGVQLATSVLDWVAGASGRSQAATMCTASFTGGAVRLVQFISSGFDADYLCR